MKINILKLMVFFLIFFLPLDAQKISRRSAIVEVVEKTGKSIVNISTERLVKRQKRFVDEEFFDEFFGRFRPRYYKTKSLGSGIIIDAAGFIITNEHVIRRASKINVILNNKKIYNAKLISSNVKNDLALLKINADISLPAISWGTSSDLMIGETAIALGNPFGLQNTVTTGVISAIDRSIAIQGKIHFHDYIQTDAAINPGNSGGALLNIHAQLIGVNAAIYAKGQGLGFAIPIDRVRIMLGHLLNYKQTKKYYLGVQLEEIQDGIDWEVKIRSVKKGSPAWLSGLRKNHHVVSVDEQSINSIFDFNKIIFLKNLGNKVKIRARKGQKYQDFVLQIYSSPLQLKQKNIWRRLGITLKNSQKGVRVVQVRKQGPAHRIGVTAGDILMALDNYEIRNVQNVHTMLKYIANKAVSVMLVRHGESLVGKIAVE